MNFDIGDIDKNKNKTIQIKRQKLLTYVSILFFIISIGLVMLYYISSNNNEEKQNNIEPTTIEQPEVKKITIVNEKSNERPIAIMIDNNIGNNKHAGLQDSYVNYEIIVEGGLTRIMAIYKDRDIDLIGPVRSARHYFLDYALEHDAIYTHFGWSPYAESNIKSFSVNNINGMTDDEPFTRDKSIPSPHNVFTSISNIKSCAQNKNYSMESLNWQLFKYSVDEIMINSESQDEEVSIANHISMNYSYSENRSYTYDNDNKYYLRLDSEGRQDLDTVGTGSGYYITNGYAKPISWSKTSRTAKTKYTYNDGKEIVLNDGNTFVQIIPISSDLIIE